jgi:hypothetical protein
MRQKREKDKSALSALDCGIDMVRRYTKFLHETHEFTYAEIERAFNQRPANGMTAWRMAGNQHKPRFSLVPRRPCRRALPMVVQGDVYVKTRSLTARTEKGDVFVRKIS